MRSGFQRLSVVLDSSLGKLQGNAGLEARAVMLWAEVVGPKIAQVTEAQSVRNGVLHVAVRSSEWGTEIGFLKPDILQKYRKLLGRDVVRGVRTRVDAVRGAAPPAARTAPEEEVRKVRLPAEELARIEQAAAGADPILAAAIRRTLTREAKLRHWRLKHGARACGRCGAAHRSPRSLCPACRQDERLQPERSANTSSTAP